MSRLSRIESCKLCPRFLASLRCAVVNLFAYTFCKITLCGLHPARAPSFTAQHAARFKPSSASFRCREANYPPKFHPRSLMYAELYGRNSKFGMAVLGAFTMSFHPLVLSFVALRCSGRDDATLARQDSAPPPSVIRGEHA